MSEIFDLLLQKNVAECMMQRKRNSSMVGSGKKEIFLTKSVFDNKIKSLIVLAKPHFLSFYISLLLTN